MSATGSGKTYTAAAAALDCFRDGRILVMVPTLDLLVQTAAAWRTIGHRGPMVAVCSLESDEVLERLGVRGTTNPVRLALWVGSGPVVVFATYASLVDRESPTDPEGLRKARGPWSWNWRWQVASCCTGRPWPPSTSRSSTRPTEPRGIWGGRGRRSMTRAVSRPTSVST